MIKKKILKEMFKSSQRKKKQTFAPEKNKQKNIYMLQINHVYQLIGQTLLGEYLYKVLASH